MSILLGSMLQNYASILAGPGAARPVGQNAAAVVALRDCTNLMKAADRALAATYHSAKPGAALKVRWVESKLREKLLSRQLCSKA